MSGISDRLRFERICKEDPLRKLTASGIGTYKERRLHAVLKRFFEENEENHEISLLGYVVDIQDKMSIIEIQTSDFYRMKAKLKSFLDNGYTVTVVYPVAAKKWILWVNTEDGSITNRRKSPRDGTVFDIIPELYSIRELLCHKSLNFCIMLLEVEDYRLLCGYSRDKKKGSRRYERIPLSLHEQKYLRHPSDYHIFLPENLTDSFFAAEYATTAKVPSSVAYKALAILIEKGLVRKGEKEGREYRYHKISSTI